MRTRRPDPDLRADSYSPKTSRRVAGGLHQPALDRVTAETRERDVVHGHHPQAGVDRVELRFHRMLAGLGERPRPELGSAG